ncbi:MAG: DUF370 domain-containing protein [Firmicutes bacterium]|nr:DUF370 domain-containing protein [Bacillota bacterium]
MYLHLGNAAVVRKQDILGIFDLDSSSQSHLTREFLAREEKRNRVQNVSEESLPKSFVLCADRTYLSPLATATLLKRVEGGDFDL